MNYLALIAFTSGAAITLQAALNAQLSIFLKNSMLATCIAFGSSLFFIVLPTLIISKQYPSLVILKSIPIHLWYSGGILSALAISMFYYLIPKMGIASMMSFALTGQLLVAVIIGHFGWFDAPVKPISFDKVFGSTCLVFGIIFISRN